MLRIIRRNFGYKFLSLLTAILLYYLAYTQQSPKMSRELYLTPKVINLPPPMLVKKPPIANTISISGPANVVETLSPRLIQATVDLSGAQLGKNHLAVQYHVPDNIRSRIVLDTESAQETDVVLDRQERQDYGVKVVFDNNAPAGFKYSTPLVEPHSVTVTGLPDEVKRVFRVVAFVDKADAVGAVDTHVNLVAQDDGKHSLDNVDIIPNQARVRFDLRPAPVNKRLILSAQLDNNPAPGYTVRGYTFTPSQIAVEGQTDTLANLSALTVHVDVNGLSSPTNRTVTVTPPLGIKIVEKGAIRVRVDVRPITTPFGAGVPPTSGGTRVAPHTTLANKKSGGNSTVSNPVNTATGTSAAGNGTAVPGNNNNGGASDPPRTP